MVSSPILTTFGLLPPATLHFPAAIRLSRTPHTTIEYSRGFGPLSCRFRGAGACLIRGPFAAPPYSCLLLLATVKLTQPILSPPPNHQVAMFTKMVGFPYTGMTMMGFARQHVGRTEVWPFVFSGLFALFALGGLGFGGTKEARAASKYLNPPKHH